MPIVNSFIINAQKRHRCHRDAMGENILTWFHAHVKDFPDKAVNFREIFESELFRIALKQVISFFIFHFG